ncbi:MAG: TolC family protein [Oceanospirillaceae bacterium]|nr:TolC family protein [Oceanospirillaceae bacterium]
MITKQKPFYLSLLSAVLLTGCASGPSSHSYIGENTKAPLIAEQYQADTAKETTALTNNTVSLDGLHKNTNAELLTAINQALSNNHSIIEQRAIQTQALQRSIITAADQGLNLNLNSNNSLKTTGASSASSSSFDLALNGSWQFDIWGELNAQSKASQYALAQANANLKQAQQQLIGDITNAWYQLIYEQNRTNLILEQQQNSGHQLQAIESSYRQGLSDIGDVYLARANLDSAKSRSSIGAQTLSTAARKLQLLLGKYPNGSLRINGQLPSLDNNFSLGVPANLLKNRADINSSWLAVLAQDASVASHYAKQFPSFTLSGALSLSTAKLSDLFAQNLAWSLLANISQSVFDNGAKKANYQLSKALLIEREQEYLQVLQHAFSEIETLIEAQSAIQEQWHLNAQVLKNSKLSLDQISAQYQNGIANYQQVLNLQQQLFDDQKNQLSLTWQKIQNRIELLHALGNPTATNQSTESK